MPSPITSREKCLEIQWSLPGIWREESLILSPVLVLSAGGLHPAFSHSCLPHLGTGLVMELIEETLASDSERFPP